MRKPSSISTSLSTNIPIINKYLTTHWDLLKCRQATCRFCLPGCKSHLFRIRPNRLRQDLHHERKCQNGSLRLVHSRCYWHFRLLEWCNMLLTQPRFRHLTAKLSFFEIYCGKLFDLLNKRSELTLREDNKSNINIIGLEETPVDTLEKFQ